MSSLPEDLRQSVQLTVELASITTLILLVLATPLAWWLARSKVWWAEAIAAVIALPLVLPPTVLGFHLLVMLGPNGPGGLIAGLWGGRTLTFTFETSTEICSLPRLAKGSLDRAYSFSAAAPRSVVKS